MLCVLPTGLGLLILLNRRHCGVRKVRRKLDADRSPQTFLRRGRLNTLHLIPTAVRMGDGVTENDHLNVRRSPHVAFSWMRSLCDVGLRCINLLFVCPLLVTVKTWLLCTLLLSACFQYASFAEVLLATDAKSFRHLWSSGYDVSLTR